MFEFERLKQSGGYFYRRVFALLQYGVFGFSCPETGERSLRDERAEAFRNARGPRFHRPPTPQGREVTFSNRGGSDFLEKKQWFSFLR